MPAGADSNEWKSIKCPDCWDQVQNNSNFEDINQYQQVNVSVTDYSIVFTQRNLKL